MLAELMIALKDRGTDKKHSQHYCTAQFPLSTMTSAAAAAASTAATAELRRPALPLSGGRECGAGLSAAVGIPEALALGGLLLLLLGGLLDGEEGSATGGGLLPGGEGLATPCPRPGPVEGMPAPQALSKGGMLINWPGCRLLIVALLLTASSWASVTPKVSAILSGESPASTV